MHPKDFMNSSNIYNIIPKINPSKNYSHLNKNINTKTTTKNNNKLLNNYESFEPKINNNLQYNNSSSINYASRDNISNNQNYKSISINPNLSEQESQIYKGDNSSSTDSSSNRNLTNTKAINNKITPLNTWLKVQLRDAWKEELAFKTYLNNFLKSRNSKNFIRESRKY